MLCSAMETVIFCDFLTLKCAKGKKTVCVVSSFSCSNLFLSTGTGNLHVATMLVISNLYMPSALSLYVFLMSLAKCMAFRYAVYSEHALIMTTLPVWKMVAVVLGKRVRIVIATNPLMDVYGSLDSFFRSSVFPM